MRASRGAAFVSLLLLGALAVWSWRSLGSVPPAPPGADAVSAVTAPAAGPADAMAAARTSVELPAQPAAETPAEDTAPIPTGHLRVIARSERGDALGGCRVLAAEQEAVTDRSGTVTFELAAERTFIAVDPPSGHALRGRSGWQSLRPEQWTEVTVVLPAIRLVPFCCQFVAAESELPLAGVTVRMLPEDTQLRSDAEGFVEIAVPDEDTWFDVHTPGRCTGRVVPTTDHPTRASALRVPLALACSLRLLVVDQATAPVANVKFELASRPWHLQTPSTAPSRGRKLVWSATTDLAGQLTFVDLPIGIALDLTVDAPSRFAPITGQRWVMNEPAEERTLVLVDAGAVRGRVLDADGLGVAGVAVHANRTAGERMPRVLERAPAEWRTETADDGTFLLAALAPGPWWIGIPHAGRYRPTSVAVEVIAARAVEVELRAEAGLCVAGRCVDSDGLPCRDIPIRLSMDDSNVAETATDPAGRFRFEGLPGGPCQLSIRSFETDLGLAEPLTVAAGNEQVELLLTTVRGTMSGRVSGGDAWVTVYRRGGGDMLGQRCEMDGTFCYRGLRAGTWDLAAFDRSGRVACIGGVQVLPGREAAGVHVALGPSAVVRPRHATADEFLIVRDDQVVAMEGLRDGTAGQSHVPPGTWTVIFRRRGAELARRTIRVSAGQHLLVDGDR